MWRRGVPILLVVLLAACRPVPGPIDPGFAGLAYVVPLDSVPGEHSNDVPVALVNDPLGYLGTDHVGAGQALWAETLDGWAGLVALPWGNATTAIGASENFWVMPSFVELKDMRVTVGLVNSSLGASGLRYHRGTVAAFDDPATPAHDGIALLSRRFLACQSNIWSIGNQTFTTDLVELGLHRGDRTLIERASPASTGG